MQLAEDVQYYLGFFLLVRDMKGRGYSFCMPEETDKLEVKQGYDLALALRSEKEVIANDCNLQRDERFFVITGANGGRQDDLCAHDWTNSVFCQNGSFSSM